MTMTQAKTGPESPGDDGKANKMYRCKMCNEEFVHRNVLKEHNEKMHSSVRVPCDQCDKTFTTKSSLRLHKEAIHDGIRYQCSFCEKSFGQLGSLRRHIKSIHPSMKHLHQQQQQRVGPAYMHQPASLPLLTPILAQSQQMLPTLNSHTRAPKAANSGAGDASPRSTGSESTVSLMSITGHAANGPATLSKHARKRSAGDLLNRWPEGGSPPKVRRSSPPPPATIPEDELLGRDLERHDTKKRIEKEDESHRDALGDEIKFPAATAAALSHPFTHSESQAIAILASLQMRAR
ncbi:Zinc finger protein 384 [Hondaea fermentalgiana]|uniref:Zinc finger protein 384 n=1 Tax=Hondaea fermentalgiana TaxID=2315210 RepID=A0A2R5GHZ2_9STRA|nr:Zinc finger protein 384 [Hondaea fermentalgiana]|eukprot:GBG30507.1 Zinc finger protein 384 [Hondaea fermentalgiana]